MAQLLRATFELRLLSDDSSCQFGSPVSLVRRVLQLQYGLRALLRFVREQFTQCQANNPCGAAERLNLRTEPLGLNLRPAGLCASVCTGGLSLSEPQSLACRPYSLAGRHGLLSLRGSKSACLAIDHASFSRSQNCTLETSTSISSTGTPVAVETASSIAMFESQ